jgi:hypothetical protein
MKTITRIKNVIQVSLDPEMSTEHDRYVRHLSDVIFDLTRGLYRYEVYRCYDLNQPDFPEEKLFEEFDLHTPLQDRKADEVWVFGSSGQSRIYMGGSHALWLGDNPLQGTANIFRRFPVMRFGPLPLLKVYAKRVENTMYQVYRGYPPAKNMWEHFIQTARSTSGVAGCGSVTYPPNGVLEGYSSDLTFLSSCEDWLFNYPEFKNRVKFIDSGEWGGTLDGYLKWWLGHIPHGLHKTDGVHDNWWHYVMNLDLIK